MRPSKTDPTTLDLICASFKSCSEASPTTIPISKNFGPFDDVPVCVAKIVHCASQSPVAWDKLPEDKQGEKESKVKRVLNSIAVKHMTKAMLDEMDPEGDVLEWFEDMKTLIAAGVIP